MPEMNGLELTRAVKEKFPKIKILALSMFGERNAISEIPERNKLNMAFFFSFLIGLNSKAFYLFLLHC